MRNPLAVTFFRDFISLFYPSYCLGCSGTLVKGEELVCTVCMLEMAPGDYVTFDNNLRRRLAARMEIDMALPMFRFTKSGRIQRLLHSLKYRNQPEIGVRLGNVFGQRIRDANISLKADFILPVPLHRSRQRKRGYNQSLKFAEGLSLKLNIPVLDHVLIRQSRTDTQTRKTKLKRWENVHSVFAVKDPTQIIKKRLILVDDVITTGATVEACAAILRASGAETISVMCIAEA